MKDFNAYSEFYFPDAQKNIAWAFEYGTIGLGYTLSEFVQKWLDYEYLNLIETGNPHFIAGMSGIELAMIVAGRQSESVKEIEYTPSAFYWTGFVTAYYQWKNNCTYKKIFDAVTADDFLCMYKTFHEQDITSVALAIDEKIAKKAAL